MDENQLADNIMYYRKKKGLSQEKVSEYLDVSRQAVTKWESNISRPSSNNLIKLAQLFEVDVETLLGNGAEEKSSTQEKADMERNVKKADENKIRKNVLISILFSVTLFIGIIVCLICNLAISGNLTWSLIPISSIVFAWVISFPSIILGKRGIIVSLISLSVFIVPYLFLLSNLLNIKEVFSVGVVMAVISVVFLWIIVVVFRCIGKTRKLVALGISFLLTIPFVFIVNVMLSKMISESIIDVWDMLTVFILLILAFISFFYDYAKKRSLQSKN